MPAEASPGRRITEVTKVQAGSYVATYLYLDVDICIHAAVESDKKPACIPIMKPIYRNPRSNSK